MGLTNKIAVVTGASRGIGRAIARRLAQEGALVVVHYGHGADAAAETVQDIEANGGQAFAAQADLGSLASIEQFFTNLDTELTTRTGQAPFDILVNNAGLGSFSGYDQTTEAEFDRLFRVNVKGTYFLTRHALPRLRDGGRIITLSSAASHHPSPRATVSTMTKAALDAFTIALAGAVGKRGITANIIAPGAVETNMNRAAMQNPQTREYLSHATALGRIGQVEDIAGAVVMLASDDAGWITGQYIEASGGLRLGD